ncbi:hypothetical protein NCCP2140_28130 [Pseudoalteromonas sp. NCCP-2140]|uniref:hypothetical protein n=1 Tax=Pseudoalteromonas sp. NCCP-2140 TaxID=2942288 RepID=UPI002041763B|nr:hypothetical protein [Pseudoalteromonas sp. NCCP-2140]GKW53760.1 hypothetical protein NCCP2140_28130 [Pseudoalteromonas sp. NCCP-2140]
MTLLIFTFSSFLICGLLGYFKNWRIWNWIDIIYYPLGAIGITLIFFQSESERYKINLIELELLAKNELAVIEKEKPNFESYHNEDSLIAQFGKHLEIVSGFASACGGYNLDSKCPMSVKLASITKKYEPLFYNGNGVDLAHSICSKSPDLIDEIVESNILSSTLNRTLPEYYALGLKKDYHQFGFEAVNELLMEFESFSKREFNDVVINSRYFDENSIKRLTRDFDDGLYFSKSILRSISICFRTPKSIRNGQYSRWIKKVENKKTKLDGLHQEITAPRDNVTNEPIDIFSFFYWPYIIIAALSLKFGKAVNGIRPK